MHDASANCSRTAFGFIPDERYWRTGSTRMPQPVFARMSGTEPLPPVTQLLRARRGGAERRLRLLLWLAALSRGGAVQDIESPNPRQLGPVIGISQRQERQVYEAFRSLIDSGLVGRPSRGRFQMLLPPSRPWPNWTADDWAKHHELRQQFCDAGWLGGDPDRHPDLWVTHDVEIPNRLLADGTILSMSAAAVVVLLTMLDAQKLDPEPEGAWFRLRRHRSARYGYSYDTHAKGVSELAELRLLEQASAVTESVPDVKFRLHMDGTGPGGGPTKVGPNRRIAARGRVSLVERIDDRPAPTPPRCRDCGLIRSPGDGAWYRLGSRKGGDVWWCSTCTSTMARPN